MAFTLHISKKVDDSKEIIKYSYASNKMVASLFSSSVKEGFNFDDYQLSSDENWILLASEKNHLQKIIKIFLLCI